MNATAPEHEVVLMPSWDGVQEQSETATITAKNLSYVGRLAALVGCSFLEDGRERVLTPREANFLAESIRTGLQRIAAAGDAKKPARAKPVKKQKRAKPAIIGTHRVQPARSELEELAELLSEPKARRDVQELLRVLGIGRGLIVQHRGHARW